MADIKNLAYLSTRNRPVRYYKKPQISWVINPEDAKKNGINKVMNFPDERAGLANFIGNQTGLNSLADKLVRDYYTFPHVQNIELKYARDVSEQYGLQAFSVLPWYTKAVVVTVKGLDYLGSFVSAGSLPLIKTVATPLVINQMRDELMAVDAMLAYPGVVNTDDAAQNKNIGFLSAITIGIPGEVDRVELMGFIKGLDISESVEKPFLHSYTLTYIGLDNYFYRQKTAADRVNADAAVATTPPTAQENAASKPPSANSLPVTQRLRHPEQVM